MSRNNYLTIEQFHRLNWACVPLTEAFDSPPYLVGSVLERPDYKDVDLRLILDDTRFAAMFGDTDPVAWFLNPLLLVLNVAISNWLTTTTGLPVDFQFQAFSTQEHGPRNPLGRRRSGSAPFEFTPFPESA